MSERSFDDAPGAVAAEDDWDRHWDEFSEASAHNPAVAYRARLMLKLIGAKRPPQRLLDIGVGSGDFLALAAEQWPRSELAGVDVSQAGVQIAARRVPHAALSVADLTAASQTPAGLENWATHAVCSEVLEHVDEPVVLLRRAAAMMGPGCLVVITVPGGEMSAFDHHIGHRRHFSPQLLRTQLEQAGLEQIETLQAGFPFFNLYRAVVRLRGERLIEDVGAGDTEPSRAAVAAMATFGALFRLNLTRSRWGLQMVALARRPA